MNIVSELSNFSPHITESNVLALDDPALCRYPIVYMTEAGYWTMTDQEAAAFRAYLLKGGFAIFDDFRGDFPTPSTSFRSSMIAARRSSRDSSKRTKLGVNYIIYGLTH